MYVIIWEFRPKPESRGEFEKVYKANGVWARFFQTGKGYLGSELIKQTDSSRYFTIDRWVSEAAYLEFKTSFENEYHSIDAQCESLTESETYIGAFNSID